MGEPYSVHIGPPDALGSAGGGMTGQPTPAKDLIVELTVDAEELRTLLAEMRALTDELTRKSQELLGVPVYGQGALF